MIYDINSMTESEKQAYISLIETDKKLHEKASLEKNILDYISHSMWRFKILGFIEIPHHKEYPVMELNKFVGISHESNETQKKYFLPVGFMIQEETFFNDDDISQGKYIIYFLGNDNTSYGKRFHSQAEAHAFVEKGWLCGFEHLMWYNS